MTQRDCVQCNGRTQNNKRCTRSTCIYPGYCWQHAAAHYSTKIKQSTIPNSGKGLFARRDLKPLEVIGPYDGIVTEEEIEGDYVLQNDKRHIDARSTQSCMARYANACNTANKKNKHCKGNNARFDKGPGGNVVLRVLGDPIKAGQEIFVSYDKYYNFAKK